MKQCLTNIHGELHQQKTSTGTQFSQLNSAITDEINGLDAIALRLSDVESDLSHSLGIKKSLKDLQSEVMKIKEHKVNVQLEGEEVGFLQSKLEALEKVSDIQGFRIEMITGILIRQQQQLDSLKLAKAGNVTNYIIDNIIIGGIAKSDKEDCCQKSAHFFMDRMDLHPCQEDILSAERIFRKRSDQGRYGVSSFDESSLFPLLQITSVGTSSVLKRSMRSHLQMEILC